MNAAYCYERSTVKQIIFAPSVFLIGATGSFKVSVKLGALVS